ncbi:26946_t:CDS:1, partial [Dentiscutata erythropus]
STVYYRIFKKEKMQLVKALAILILIVQLTSITPSWADGVER